MEEQKKNEEVKIEEKNSDKIVISKKKMLVFIGVILFVIFVFLISIAILLSSVLHSARGKARMKSYENKRNMMEINNSDNFDNYNCDYKEYDRRSR